MVYRTICIDNTFKAGMAVGSLRALAAGQGFGSVEVIGIGEKTVTVDLAANSSLIMAFMEDQLAEYV